MLLQEEIGLEYDEDVGVSLQSYSDLLQRGKKRPSGDLQQQCAKRPPLQ